MLEVGWGPSPQVNIDLHDHFPLSVGSLLIGGVFKEGGAYTCQDDIFNLMNTALLQDYSKYSPLFKKVKKTCLDILFFLIYANS